MYVSVRGLEEKSIHPVSLREGAENEARILHKVTLLGVSVDGPQNFDAHLSCLSPPLSGYPSLEICHI